MGRLINMLLRVAIWGGFGLGLGYVLVMAYELMFTGGALQYTSSNAISGATVGGVIGAVVGFFRRN